MKARGYLAPALLGALAIVGIAAAQYPTRARLSSVASSSSSASGGGWYWDGGAATTTGQQVVATPGPIQSGGGGISTDGGIRVTGGSLGGVFALIQADSVTNSVGLLMNGNANATGFRNGVGSSGAWLEAVANANVSIILKQIPEFPAGLSSTIASGSVGIQGLSGAKWCRGTGGTACDSTLLGFGMSQTDQSADCDNAATGNAGSGKVCVGAGQGSMVLTNSAIGTTSIIQLTNVSDDATCISGYATVAAGSATIGCVGTGTATANTVFAFVVFNP